MSYGPITSPYFPEMTEWPYIKGPIYTRPVFAEHTRKGNFVINPIIRMPALHGFGEDAAPAAAPTPESVCSGAQTAGDTVYAQCLKFNKELMAAVTADPAKAKDMTAQLEKARSACESKQGDPVKWPACYYGELAGGAWWQNPMYLGVAILGGALVLGLATKHLRSAV